MRVQDAADEISSKLEEVQHAADEFSSKLEEVQDAADEISSKLKEVHDAVEDICSKPNEVSRNTCTRLDRSPVENIDTKYMRIEECFCQKPENVCGSCKNVIRDSKELDVASSKVISSYTNTGIKKERNCSTGISAHARMQQSNNLSVISSHVNPDLKKEGNSDAAVRMMPQSNKLISRPKEIIYRPENPNGGGGNCARKLFFLAVGGLAFFAVWSFLMKICRP
ncbi:hypothetical protein JTE90_015925 [Oedothorax gibbosus]|uniref:Uncharacterized protein n=1 Tax=Oedothorax gibbosus TaxID=931172 RepID=A0AAV6U1E6_9ARAC|nr:hypothetical protein JTE90_015925 [Oedothorax gibbosus]